MAKCLIERTAPFNPVLTIAETLSTIMKTYSIITLVLILIVSCKKEIVETTPVQFVPIPSAMKGFINQPNSHWVYKRSDGRIDTARLSKIDSFTVRFNNYSPSDFIDVMVCEMNYDFAFSFHRKFIIKSSLISDSYDKWGMPWGNLRYVDKNVNIEIGDTICGFDNCISLVEHFDSLKIENEYYYNVIKYETDEQIRLWWDPKVGLIQYEENNQTWKLLNFLLIK